MKDDTTTISINQNDLVARLSDVDKQAGGDLARMIELLLIENHILRLQQSSGFRRGVPVRYETFPRFLEFSAEPDATDDIEQAAEHQD